MSNTQAGNVGNEGDILKHAALVAVAEELAKGTDGPLLYVDTHAFVPAAPLAFPSWSKVADALPAAAESYRRLERTSVAADGSYLCSTGLVAAVWKGRDFRMIVAERDAKTREDLTRALGTSVQAEVLDEATLVAARVAEHTGVAAALVLVDPFRMSPENWSLAEAVAAATNARRTALVAFDYGQRTSWPDICAGLERIAEVHRGRYHLAAYGDAAAAEVVWRRLG